MVILSAISHTAYFDGKKPIAVGKILGSPDYRAFMFATLDYKDNRM